MLAHCDVIKSRLDRALRRASILLALVLLTICAPVLASDAAAKAPPLATVVFDVDVLAAPALDAEVLAVVPAGSDLVMTGAAAPGFLEVYYDHGAGWVQSQFVSIGERPGVDTAVTTEDTPMLAAPIRDADVLLIVPESETVILTGATVDGYDAGSYDGTGGWINSRALAR